MENKFELQKTEKGFLFLPMKGSDTAKFGGIGVCDFCANYAAEGKLIPALNCYYCNDCFERWNRDASYYPEDSNYENRKAQYYLEILNNH
ncbi:hypothetical protein [Sphingobacterium detergens]|uniref:hypothetical protein n=1 Tax=Sphingobacterium detergens TaxID=1145106 RepID=UPI003AAB1C7D